ncbi:MAG: hypothetical protein M1823_005742 [Watsoniomyces obsoletus]|nr:MAG: hypothetical protein M1823_005742 [Watsoniomyces obsoletus]
MDRAVLQYPILGGQSTRLNTIDVYLPSDQESGETDDSSKIWIIYIHGGAWRDPDATSETFIPASEMLRNEVQFHKHVAGMAAINYRLSPYPAKQGDDPPDDPARNARHPDHIEDVLSGLKFLQDKYGFGERYVLVGHSAGATLAWHVLMYTGSTASISAMTSMTNQECGLPLPQAIVSVAGVYDIPSLLRRHKDNPIYEEFVRGAFGDSSDEWLQASPLQWLQDHDLDQEWPNGRVVILAQSKEDGQVENEQVTDMWDTLCKQNEEQEGKREQQEQSSSEKLSNGDELRGRRHQQLIWLEGEHDSVWKEGKQLVNVILAAIDRLF